MWRKEVWGSYGDVQQSIWNTGLWLKSMVWSRDKFVDHKHRPGKVDYRREKGWSSNFVTYKYLREGNRRCPKCRAGGDLVSWRLEEEEFERVGGLLSLYYTVSLIFVLYSFMNNIFLCVHLGPTRMGLDEWEIYWGKNTCKGKWRGSWGR